MVLDRRYVDPLAGPGRCWVVHAVGEDLVEAFARLVGQLAQVAAGRAVHVAQKDQARADGGAAQVGGLVEHDEAGEVHRHRLEGQQLLALDRLYRSASNSWVRAAT